jgi:hypothetical protein
VCKCIIQLHKSISQKSFPHHRSAILLNPFTTPHTLPIATFFGPNPGPLGAPVPTAAGFVDAGRHAFILKLVVCTLTANDPRCAFCARKKLAAIGNRGAPVAARKETRSKPTRPWRSVRALVPGLERMLAKQAGTEKFDGWRKRART